MGIFSSHTACLSMCALSQFDAMAISILMEPTHDALQVACDLGAPDAEQWADGIWDVSTANEIMLSNVIDNWGAMLMPEFLPNEAVWNSHALLVQRMPALRALQPLHNAMRSPAACIRAQMLAVLGRLSVEASKITLRLVPADFPATDDVSAVCLEGHRSFQYAEELSTLHTVLDIMPARVNVAVQLSQGQLGKPGPADANMSQLVEMPGQASSEQLRTHSPAHHILQAVSSKQSEVTELDIELHRKHDHSMFASLTPTQQEQANAVLAEQAHSDCLHLIKLLLLEGCSNLRKLRLCLDWDAFPTTDLAWSQLDWLFSIIADKVHLTEVELPRLHIATPTINADTALFCHLVDNTCSKFADAHLSCVRVRAHRANSDSVAAPMTAMAYRTEHMLSFQDMLLSNNHGLASIECTLHPSSARAVTNIFRHATTLTQLCITWADLSGEQQNSLEQLAALVNLQTFQLEHCLLHTAHWLALHNAVRRMQALRQFSMYHTAGCCQLAAAVTEALAYVTALNMAICDTRLLQMAEAAQSPCCQADSVQPDHDCHKLPNPAHARTAAAIADMPQLTELHILSSVLPSIAASVAAWPQALPDLQALVIVHDAPLLNSSSVGLAKVLVQLTALTTLAVPCSPTPDVSTALPPLLRHLRFTDPEHHASLHAALAKQLQALQQLRTLTVDVHVHDSNVVQVLELLSAASSQQGIVQVAIGHDTAHARTGSNGEGAYVMQPDFALAAP